MPGDNCALPALVFLPLPSVSLVRCFKHGAGLPLHPKATYTNPLLHVLSEGT